MRGRRAASCGSGGQGVRGGEEAGRGQRRGQLRGWLLKSCVDEKRGKRGSSKDSRDEQLTEWMRSKNRAAARVRAASLWQEAGACFLPPSSPRACLFRRDAIVLPVHKNRLRALCPGMQVQMRLEQY